MRAIVTNPGGTVHIVIPARKVVAAMVLLPLWLCVWGLVEWVGVATLLCGETGFANPMVILWLAAWTLAGGLSALVFLWMLGGHEVITADGEKLTIRREIFGQGITREFVSREVHHVRVVPPGARRKRAFPSGQPASIEFDYGNKSYQFGFMIEDREAQVLVGEVARSL